MELEQRKGEETNERRRKRSITYGEYLVPERKHDVDEEAQVQFRPGQVTRAWASGHHLGRGAGQELAMRAVYGIVTHLHKRERRVACASSA